MVSKKIKHEFQLSLLSNLPSAWAINICLLTYYTYLIKSKVVISWPNGAVFSSNLSKSLRFKLWQWDRIVRFVAASLWERSARMQLNETDQQQQLHKRRRQGYNYVEIFEWMLHFHSIHSPETAWLVVCCERAVRYSRLAALTQIKTILISQHYMHYNKVYRFSFLPTPKAQLYHIKRD